MFQMVVKVNVQNDGLQHRYTSEYESRLIPYFGAKCPMRCLRTPLESHPKVSPGYVVYDMVNVLTNATLSPYYVLHVSILLFWH